MALWIDTKYANLVSPRLKRFRVKKQSPYEANFRCPICGDSKKSDIKARCWFYERDGRLTVKCFNCLSGETKLLTREHGPIEIGKVAGEYVTVRCLDGIWRKRLVERYGKRSLIDIGFGNEGKDNGLRLFVKATPDHGWFVERTRGIVERVEDLQVGDVIHHREIPMENFPPQAVVHGMIFGDGYYRRKNGEKRYAVIRICKTGDRGDEMVSWLEKAGYKVGKMPSWGNDRYSHLGVVSGLKNLPDTFDPSYIAGFIHGWMLADGTHDFSSITTIRKEAADWLEKFGPMVGIRVTKRNVVDRKPGSGYPNAKPLHYMTISRKRRVVVRSIQEVPPEETFCLTEPVTGGFWLAGGFITGNCGAHPSFKKFLAFVDPTLEKDYAFESFREGNNQNSQWGYAAPAAEVVDKVVLGDPYVVVSALNDFHPAKTYLRRRLIPNFALSQFGWVDDFTKFTNSYLPDKLDIRPEGRIIIPLLDKYGTMFGFQGRSLKPDGNRYITIMLSDKPKVFGLDRVDEDRRVYVVEGPFDSLFLDNGVAMVGADAAMAFTDQVLVYDNDPRNLEIVARMERAAARGEKIVVWPASFQHKDVNDAVVAGIPASAVQAIIDGNTYQGLAAKLRLMEWKKT